MTSERRERLGDYRAASHRYRPTRQEFEHLVADVLNKLPAEFSSQIENVAVVVQEWPRQQRSDVEEELLGLYEGVPLGQRSDGYHLLAPDRITIYRGPLLRLCRTRTELLKEIEDTIRHEIGHYFGLPEDELP